MTLYECLRRCTGMCNESRVTCMKNYAWWLCHKYDVNYMIMHGNMTIWSVSYERNGGKLHGNISRNGYGNAMIGRYGGCFEEGIWWVYGTGESCAVQERLAMVEGWECVISMDSTLVIRTHILIAKIYESSKQSNQRMLLGGRLVGVNHRAPPTSTQRLTLYKYLML